MENEANLEIKQETKRKSKLNGLAGLKFIAVLLMFYWHSELVSHISSAIDFGARCCEFLFVVSGFLVVYNYKRKYNNIFKETVSYSIKKLVKIWPLHLLALFLMLFIERATFSTDKIPALLINMFLLHSWFNNSSISMSFNGISWFLSAIFFCYVLVPVLIKLCRNYKIALVLFVLLAIGRVAFDCNLYRLGFVNDIVNTHTSFLVRLTEFLMGMLICPIYIKLKEKINFNPIKEKIVFTIIELLAIMGTVLCMIYFKSQTRAEFSVLMSVLVFLIAFDKGLISKLFSFQPFRFLSEIQFEFYIMHAVVIVVCEAIWFKILKLGNVYISSLITLSVLIFACWIYKKYISKYVDKFMKRVFNKLFRVTKLNIIV